MLNMFHHFSSMVRRKVFWSQCLSEVMASSPLMMKEFTIWQRLATDRTFQWSDKPLDDHLGLWSGTGGNMWRELYLLLLASQHPGIVLLLQIYSWTIFKGVNVVEYCKCEGFSKCSTSWDPYDGKSITQAQSDQYKVGTHIEAFIDTQQLQNVGIFYHESHQCQFTKWFWAVKTCFTTMGGKFLGTSISGENSRKTGKCGIFSHFLKFQNSNQKSEYLNCSLGPKMQFKLNDN